VVKIGILVFRSAKHILFFGTAQDLFAEAT